MKSSKKQWFYLNLGQRRGPVSKEKLCDLIERKEIYYTDVQVWKEGMKEWLPVAQVRSFSPSIKKVEAAPVVHKGDSLEAKEMEYKEQDSYIGGLSRLGYNIYSYLGWAVIYLIGVILAKELVIYGVFDAANPEQMEWKSYVPWVLVGIVTLTLTASRMRNAGYAGTWSLGLLVPVLNLWVLLVSLCGPKNYRRRKRLGMAGMGYFFFCVCVTLGTLFLNMGGHHINTKGMEEAAVSIYSKVTKMEARQNRQITDRAEDKMEEAEQKREYEKKGRDGRAKTEREAEVEKAVQGIKE